MKSSIEEPSPTHECNAGELSPERREALRKIAAWTPPAMLTLLLSSRASADSIVNETSNDAPDPGTF